MESTSCLDDTFVDSRKSCRFWHNQGMLRLSVFGWVLVVLGTGCQSPDMDTVKAVMPNVTESNATVHCGGGACLRIVTFSRKQMWVKRGTITTQKFEKLIVKAHEGVDEKAMMHLYFADEDNEFLSAFASLSYDEALDQIRNTDVMPLQAGITIQGEDGITAKSSTDPDWMSLIMGVELVADSLGR